ncbi:dihydroxyacetone kinase phosphoryl donor subunit DhaM [Isoptericola cucumis]|uniref:dihydroxyacetone kinase phosphoryl donor subunit DhaM n=1 Tax=Isoptericola cucumis TaxID=1776856 RepID=UPI00320814B9
MSVALLLVSHSARLADGTAELAHEMAPDVVVANAAGDVDGGLGTSLEKVTEALTDLLADGAAGVVVLADLGSAVLTVESALELDDDLPPRVRLASAPFVEGAVAAAVTAQQGAGLDAVVASAEGAVTSIGPRPVVELVEAGPSPDAGPAGTVVAGEVVGTVGAPLRGSDVATASTVVRNPLGLHARPAALVARTAASFGIPVRIQGVDATSVLQLMALGTAAGTELEVTAQGPGAETAVATVVGLIDGGFGEA